ncbi:MAG TPA: HNH endonuclease signature motif containing protein [bacterium]|nr:HNH endonuclease signature motif containing protein [bacterium]
MNWNVGDRYEGLILETCKDVGITRPRVSPLEDSKIKVKFPRHLREEYPLGTRFQANVVVAQKMKNGKLYGDPYLVAETKSITLIKNYTPEKIIDIVKLGDRVYKYIEENVIETSFTDLRKRAYENAKEEAQISENLAVVKNRIKSQALYLYILARSKGYCEACDSQAPFLRRNGEPYLEIHHIDEVCNGGADSPENLVALCPNCHRRVTSGIDAKEYNMEIKRKILEKEK